MDLKAALHSIRDKAARGAFPVEPPSVRQGRLIQLRERQWPSQRPNDVVNPFASFQDHPRD